MVTAVLVVKLVSVVTGVMVMVGGGEVVIVGGMEERGGTLVEGGGW